MKFERPLIRILSIVIMCVIVVSSSEFVTVASSEASLCPYELIDGGCIAEVEMRSSENMSGKIQYFTASVNSHIQGVLNNSKIPYDVFGAIGSSESRMFVYSIGSEDDQDYANHTVLSITEEFEKNNPAWDAVVAVNGDFFDIETKATESLGEPEGTMIQMGSVYKGTLTNALGRGVVGIKRDGSMIYHTIGQIYSKMGYGTDFDISKGYLTFKVMDGETGNTLAEHITRFGAGFLIEERYLSTKDTGAKNLSKRTVYVIKCDTYRHSHISVNGMDAGTLGNYVYGEVVEIREGVVNDVAESGYAFISVPKGHECEEIRVGSLIECQPLLKDDWSDVISAVGFKQQILAEGNVLLKNCYGTYNQGGDKEETLRWTEDIYDYPYCWKNRTALGFRADGTPVLLVVGRSSDTGAYKNLGASYYEVGEQLKALGCVNGFLLDGGGSSTFVIRNKDGSFSNAFVGEGDGRKVANAVILAIRDKSVSLPEDEDTVIEGITNIESSDEAANGKNTAKKTFDLKYVSIGSLLAVALVTGCITLVIVRKKRR